MNDHDLADAAYEVRAREDLVLISRLFNFCFTLCAGVILFVAVYVVKFWPS